MDGVNTFTCLCAPGMLVLEQQLTVKELYQYHVNNRNQSNRYIIRLYFNAKCLAQVVAGDFYFGLYQATMAATVNIKEIHVTALPVKTQALVKLCHQQTATDSWILDVIAHTATKVRSHTVLKDESNPQLLFIIYYILAQTVY